MSRQELARQRVAASRVVDYVGRLGLRRAAKRFGVDLATLSGWINRRRFPGKILPDALTISIVGPAEVIVRRASAAKIIKKLGVKKASKLTGLPQAALKQIARKNKNIKFKRWRLLDLVKRRGAKKIADEIGAQPAAVRASCKPVKTATTRRLQELVKTYGTEQIGSYVGVAPETIVRWLRDNVPQNRRPEVDQAVGRQPLEKPDAQRIKRRALPAKTAKKAKTQIAAWNKGQPANLKITPRAIARWVKTGTFKESFADAKKAVLESRQAKKPKPVRRPTPPPPAPRPRLLPEKKKPKKPKRPERLIQKPVKDEDEAQKLRNFEELRAYYINTGNPEAEKRKRWHDDPWGRPVKRSVGSTSGVHEYGRVETFVHRLDLEQLKRKINERARKIWCGFPLQSPQMTVRFTMCAQGSGNPFYEGAWIPDLDKLQWFRNNTFQITDEGEIERAVASAVEEIADVCERMLLFLEHYEITKSTS